MSAARAAKIPAPRLEVHQHSYIRGPLATWGTMNFDHAHEAGDTGHQHPDTGPAQFTIDKREWFAATGLHGGGKKSYARTPTAPLLERVELEDWQRGFKVVFTDWGHTPELERAGITAEQYQREANDVAAAAAGNMPTLPADGSPGTGGAAVARMALGFDLDVTYVYEDRRGEPLPVPRWPPRTDRHDGYGEWGVL